MKKFSDLPESTAKIVMQCARGKYQIDCLTGEQNWAGSDLRGKAKRYNGHYARSRHNLLSRINAVLDDFEATSILDLQPINNKENAPRRWKRTLVFKSL